MHHQMLPLHILLPIPRSKVIVVPSVWDMTVRILTTLYLQFWKSSVSLEGIQAGRLSHMLFLEMKDETTSWELLRGWNKELKESEFCYHEASRTSKMAITFGFPWNSVSHLTWLEHSKIDFCILLHNHRYTQPVPLHAEVRVLRSYHLHNR